MLINICDYCIGEGKATETLVKIQVSNHVAVAACKKHEKRLTKDLNSQKDSKDYQDMIAMVSKNLLKKGKVFAGLKKKGGV